MYTHCSHLGVETFYSDRSPHTPCSMLLTNINRQWKAALYTSCTTRAICYTASCHYFTLP